LLFLAAAASAAVHITTCFKVFLADDFGAGICVFAAMLLCSPTASLLATFGSLIGALTGVWVGAEPAAVKAGLWGYNSLLGAVAVRNMESHHTFITPASFGARIVCSTKKSLGP
jgi:urea transporter